MSNDRYKLTALTVAENDKQSDLLQSQHFISIQKTLQRSVADIANHSRTH